jgi:hypothetical protein
LGPEREAELQEELDAGEEEGETKGCTEGRVRWADRGVLHFDEPTAVAV